MGKALRPIHNSTRHHLTQITIPLGHWNPSSYTEGLAGENIPLGSRLVMIADAFDAICSRRSYSEPKPKEEAIRIIRDGAGGQFDPGLVPIFEKVVDELPHPSSN